MNHRGHLRLQAGFTDSPSQTPFCRTRSFHLRTHSVSGHKQWLISAAQLVQEGVGHFLTPCPQFTCKQTDTRTFSVTLRDLVRLVGNEASLFLGPAPTVGERVDGLAGVVERRQTGALGLCGAPPMQCCWQGGRPLVGQPQTFPF